MDEFDQLTEQARNTPLDEDNRVRTIDVSIAAYLLIFGGYILLLLYSLFNLNVPEQPSAQAQCKPTITEPRNEQQSP